MPKIIPNDSFKAALLKTMVYDISNRQDNISFSIMNGPMPSKEDLLSCIANYHTHGWPTFNAAMKTNIEALNGGTQILVSGGLSAFTYQEHLEPEKVRMFFSKRTERFTPDFAGQAGWFILAYGTNTSMFANKTAYWSVAGSIGAYGSGADMELMDVNIDPSVPFKLNDVTLNYNIIGRTA